MRLKEYIWRAGAKASRLLPDRLFIQLNYLRRCKSFLNLNMPRSFNEKLQWLKLYDRKPLYTRLADKYEARRYIEETLGEEYLFPLLGVWDRAEDIDFANLPEQFVLKCNHDCAGMAICRDRSQFDFEAVREKFAKLLKRNYFWHAREWPYKNIRPRIIAEPYMEDGTGVGLTDYKFFVFNGVTKLLYISKGFEHHPTAQIAFYDLKGNRMPFRRRDYRELEADPPAPRNMEKMIALSEHLARLSESAFLRIDLYEIRDRIYFSEFTFFPCSGMIPFEPDEWDETLGDWLTLPNRPQKKARGCIS